MSQPYGVVKQADKQERRSQRRARPTQMKWVPDNLRQNLGALLKKAGAL